jgi:hypothetical protein
LKTLTEAKRAFESQKCDPGQSMRIMKISKMFQDDCETVFDLVNDNEDRAKGLELMRLAKWTLVQAISHGHPTIAAAPIKKEKHEKTEAQKA